jgi:hypothetical protein
MGIYGNTQEDYEQLGPLVNRQSVSGPSANPAAVGAPVIWLRQHDSMFAAERYRVHVVTSCGLAPIANVAWNDDAVVVASRPQSAVRMSDGGSDPKRAIVYRVWDEDANAPTVEFAELRSVRNEPTADRPSPISFGPPPAPGPCEGTDCTLLPDHPVPAAQRSAVPCWGPPDVARTTALTPDRWLVAFASGSAGDLRIRTIERRFDAEFRQWERFEEVRLRSRDGTDLGVLGGLDDTRVRITFDPRSRRWLLVWREPNGSLRLASRALREATWRMLEPRPAFGVAGPVGVTRTGFDLACQRVSRTGIVLNPSNCLLVWAENGAHQWLRFSVGDAGEYTSLGVFAKGSWGPIHRQHVDDPGLGAPAESAFRDLSVTANPSDDNPRFIAALATDTGEIRVAGLDHGANRWTRLPSFLLPDGIDLHLAPAGIGSWSYRHAGSSIARIGLAVAMS